jgi:arginase
VWLDAHPDSNTPETSPSGNIPGMPVAIVLGQGPECLVNVGKSGTRLKYEDMVLLGICDIDEGEARFIDEHGIRMFTIFDVLKYGLPAVVDQTIGQLCKRTRNLHVSLDLDVLGVEIAPGVGLPSRCGFDMREMIYICRRLASECNITSIDIVGLNPVRDQNMTTAHRAVEIIGELLGYSLGYNYYVYLKEQG